MKNFDWNEIRGSEKFYYTERIVLRPLMECDVYPMFLATTNPAFNRYLLWDAPHTVSQLSERIKKILDERRKGQMGALVAAEITTGAFVALFKAHSISPPAGSDELHFETGIWLHPNFWLDGLSVEVSATCFDYLFDETSVDVLHAQTHQDNKACLGLFRALNLQFGTETMVEHENGSLNPSFSYNIRRDQWRRTLHARENYEDINSTRMAKQKSMGGSEKAVKSSAKIV